jgi:hypothetical protein
MSYFTDDLWGRKAHSKTQIMILTSGNLQRFIRIAIGAGLTDDADFEIYYSAIPCDEGMSVRETATTYTMVGWKVSKELKRPEATEPHVIFLWHPSMSTFIKIVEEHIPPHTGVRIFKPAKFEAIVHALSVHKDFNRILNHSVNTNDLRTEMFHCGHQQRVQIFYSREDLPRIET